MSSTPFMEAKWQEPHGVRTFVTRNQVRTLVSLAVIGLVVLLWQTPMHISTSSLANNLHLAPSDQNPILNRTLGFEKVFALVLPDREDRRDPLLAAGNATNVTVTIFDALFGKDIPQDDMPEGWNDGKDKPMAEGVLGCLMSHVMVWRKIIAENLGSALVLESDADWDMRIKPSMRGLGDGVKAIADFPFTPGIQHPQDTQPYGDNWDFLWLGHCGANPAMDGRAYVYNDTSAVDKTHVWEPISKLKKGYPREDGQRLVFQVRDAMCTIGYAISNKGAHKLEKLFRTANAPIDLELHEICIKNPDVICVGTYPAVFGMAKSRSNIMGNDKTIDEEHLQPGRGLQISARINADLGLADKGPDAWKKEWEDGEKKVDEKEEKKKKEEENRKSEGKNG